MEVIVSLWVFVQEKRLSGSDSSLLAKQKNLLLQKLETFEGTNRTLRHLLREQHGREVPCLPAEGTLSFYAMSCTDKVSSVKL